MPRSKRRVGAPKRRCVERAKIALSGEPTAVAWAPGLVPERQLSLEEPVERVEFERLIRPSAAPTGTEARRDLHTLKGSLSFLGLLQLASACHNLEDALREQGVPCAEQGDGLNFWIPVEGDDQAVALALAHRGWLVRHGDAFGVQDPVRGLRVTISDINAAQSRELARDIRDSL